MTKQTNPATLYPKMNAARRPLPGGHPRHPIYPTMPAKGWSAINPMPGRNAADRRSDAATLRRQFYPATRFNGA